MSKGLAECDKCDYFISVEEAYQQGAKEFAEWLVNKGILGSRCVYNGEITDYGKVYLSEWQKGAKNE